MTLKSHTQLLVAHVHFEKEKSVLSEFCKRNCYSRWHTSTVDDLVWEEESLSCHSLAEETGTCRGRAGGTPPIHWEESLSCQSLPEETVTYSSCTPPNNLLSKLGQKNCYSRCHTPKYPKESLHELSKLVRRNWYIRHTSSSLLHFLQVSSRQRIQRWNLGFCISFQSSWEETST